MRLANLPIDIYYDEDTYIAKCSLIQGAFAEGETPQEALYELLDVLKMIHDYKGVSISDHNTHKEKFKIKIPVTIDD